MLEFKIELHVYLSAENPMTPNTNTQPSNLFHSLNIGDIYIAHQNPVTSKVTTTRQTK